MLSLVLVDFSLDLINLSKLMALDEFLQREVEVLKFQQNPYPTYHTFEGLIKLMERVIP